MDDLLKVVENKLTFLDLTWPKTDGIVTAGNVETMERHRDALRVLAKEAHDLKRKVEKKFESGSSPEEVSAWSSDVEAKLANADNCVAYLGQKLVDEKEKVNLASKQSEEALLENARKEQLEFERAQLEMKLEFARKSEKVNKDRLGETKSPNAKLPKLTITKFDGTFERWLPFWNEYKAEIDSTDLPFATKFAYLKELLDPKVRSDIDGLPFTTEGYARAKNILQSEYGRESEIVHAYVNNIMGLPSISDSNTKKIDEFYKKLLYNVQSLETLGKLRDVSGNARTVLDKLKGIKADLVRGQEGWQNWDFAQLIQALKRWKEINPIEIEKRLPKEGRRRERNYQARDDVVLCVYCDAKDHKSVKCNKVVTPAERKRILGLKRLCFNCTGSKHRAADCRSRASCQHCQHKLHSSICDKPSEKMMTSPTANSPTANSPTASRFESRKKVMSDRIILDSVRGIKIPLRKLPKQMRIAPN